MSDIAALFPGQGSQIVGMGRELAAAFPAAREVFERADDALGFRLSGLAWEGPEDELTATQNAQPAILVHSLAVVAALGDAFSERIGMAAGHSLGEFTAYALAGSLDLEEAVRLVRRRGGLMAEAGRARPGAMAAVIGLADDVVESCCRRVSEEEGVVVAANFNSPGQVVISGTTAAVRRASELAREAGARMVRELPVSGAFHSPLMTPAEAGLEAHLDELEFRDPAYPVVSNVTAEPVTESTRARALLVRQLTSPVRWVDCVRRMVAEGARTFLELGPGRVLTGLLRRIDSDATGISIGAPDDIRSFTG